MDLPPLAPPGEADQAEAGHGECDTSTGRREGPATVVAACGRTVVVVVVVIVVVVRGRFEPGSDRTTDRLVGGGRPPR